MCKARPSLDSLSHFPLNVKNLEPEVNPVQSISFHVSFQTKGGARAVNPSLSRSPTTPARCLEGASGVQEM